MLGIVGPSSVFITLEEKVADRPLAFDFPQSKHWGLRSAANPVPLPQPKPRAMRERIVVPSIGSGEVTRAQRSRVGHREDALQPLDFGDGLLGVHPPQYLTERRRGQFGRHRMT